MLLRPLGCPMYLFLGLCVVWVIMLPTKFQIIMQLHLLEYNFVLMLILLDRDDFN